VKNAQLPSQGFQRIVAMGAWFGLLTGCVEVCLQGWLRFGLGRSVYFGLYIIWLSPLVNVLVFVLLGAGLYLVGQYWPKLLAARVQLSFFLLLALFSWGLLLALVKLWTLVLLAVGLAFQGGRFLAMHLERMSGLALRAAQIMLVLIIVAAIGLDEWQHTVREHAIAELPPARADAPNVLFLILDTVRARNLSLYGYARPTSPQLQKFARRGACFKYAIATAPWTLPSHAGMFTGRYPHELSAGFRTPLDRRHSTLAEALRARGYSTAGFVANNFYCNAENGLNRGFIEYQDFRFSPSEVFLGSVLGRSLVNQDWTRRLVGYYDVVARKNAVEINEEFLAWLGQRPARPFFAFLNYLDAHEPCRPPAPFSGRFGPIGNQAGTRNAHLLRTSWRLRREQETALERQADINCYDSAIAYLDQQVGTLLMELERQDVLANTLVVITSDHGEAFGENGHFGHTDSAYLTQLHVPLLLVNPARLPVGIEIAQPVSLRDLAATVTDILSLSDKPLFPGQSLARFWKRDSATSNLSLSDAPLLSEVDVAPLRPQQYKPGVRATITSLLKPQYHYLKEPDGREKLFDYWHDPDETHDLSGNPAWRGVLDEFATAWRGQKKQREN
jgi:arylsulfatase A-like enzyme